MNWAGRLFRPESSGSAWSAELDCQSLRDRVEALILQQTASWPMLRDGYQGLQQVRTRRLDDPEAPGSFVILQHNPARIRSTAASVDQASVQSRKCFLCPENLPAEEMVLEYGDDFIIACNPFPVLDRHVSIIHRRHVEQKVDGHIGSLLGLARDLGPGYLALYNGPRCGASAPDHLHMQACSSRSLPVESSLGRLQPIQRQSHRATGPDRDLSVGILKDFARSAIVLRGCHVTELGDAINKVLANFKRATADDSEPMINIIATHLDRVWTIYLFPRARHRPACFFAEGDDRITVSPGAIDMAGLIVVPREQDFEKVGVEQAMEIFSEVSANSQLARDLAEGL